MSKKLPGSNRDRPFLTKAANQLDGRFRLAANRLEAAQGRWLLAMLVLTALSACHWRAPAGAYDAFNRADCLPALKMQDQSGRELTLASLKGKPVLVDFIYTSCPGPCLTLTQKMARVAAQMAPALGRRFTMVSITIDPEHDGPHQLAQYARQQGALQQGWLFLTASPKTVDQLLADFQLRRVRQADGSVAHLAGVFILGPDGRERREYDGEVVTVSTMVGDMRRILGARS
ncbi:MAG TPA: SCO family protein [Candidatus Binataceae bacterium]|nr:SCO family protein [Candidatus Binataceae bacterium]